MTPITRETARASAASPIDALLPSFETTPYDRALEIFGQALDRDLKLLEQRHHSYCTTSSLRKAARKLR